MKCAYCGKKIGVLRSLQHTEFCSDEHQKAYLKKQEALALDFLMQNKQRSRPEAAPVRAVESIPPAPAPAPPKPPPPVAAFVAESAPPARPVAGIERTAQPSRFPTPPVFPAATGVRSPAVCLSPSADLAVAAQTSGAHAAGRSQFPFAGAPPRVLHSPIGPVWIAPERQAPPERRQAGFASVEPKPAPREPGGARAAAAIRSAMGPSLRDVPIEPGLPAVAPARAMSRGLEINRRPAAHVASAATAWHPAWQPASEPRTRATPRKSGISCSGEMPVPVPRSSAAPQAAVRSAAVRPMAAAQPELRLAVKLGAGPRSLACAAPAAIAPRRSTPAAKATGSAAAPVDWRSQVRLGPYSRVSPIRPDLEASTPIAPADEDPIRRLEPIVHIRWTARLAQAGHAMPGWVRRLVLLALLVLVGWAGAGWLSHSQAGSASRDQMWARISRRAAIEIQDDFRTGLGQWSGGGDWAKSWSYDATGFASPGRLALLAGSLPLSDYRLEFTAQIERKAVTWVFRAADSNNYYATKLVESKHGLAPVFSIVRYAVVDGKERAKAELPLPVTVSARTLLHVRQEIRGTQFTTYLDGGIVDTWSDASLGRGGVGFFADPGESAYIRWVAVAQNDDNMGRLCGYLLALRGK